MLKVLIALDGSPASYLGLDQACTLLAGKAAQVTLLTVIAQHRSHRHGSTPPSRDYSAAEAQAFAEALLETSAKRLGDTGVGSAIHTHYEIGEPAEVILNCAESEQIDLVILGSRGLHAAARFLLGSVSTKVCTHAHCAVLVVHPRPNWANRTAQAMQAASN